MLAHRNAAHAVQLFKKCIDEGYRLMDEKSSEECVVSC